MAGSSDVSAQGSGVATATGENNASAQPRKGLCVLRPYRSTDQPAVLNLMEEATMETVNDFFWGALFSEMLPQLAFVAVAIGFVVIKLPGMYCLAMAPLAVFFMYFAIWSGHKFKVTELHGDLFNIPATYQKEANTGFWVAEVHDKVESSQLAAHFNITKKVEYEFITLEALDKRGDNLADYRAHTVAACVALTRSTQHVTRAWLRRFAVNENYRRRGIASQLLQHVLDFSRAQGYRGIELVTTECHYKAREMYLKEGFEVTMSTRYLLNVGQAIYQFTLIFPQDKKEQLKDSAAKRPFGDKTVVDEVKSYVKEGNKKVD